MRELSHIPGKNVLGRLPPWAAVALALSAGCGEAASLGTTANAKPDAGAPNNGVPGVQAHIREDFNNSQLIAASSGVLIDVNQGLVTLPATELPAATDAPLVSYTGDAEVNGVVQATQILVEDHATLRASDAIALVASDLLRVTGSIHAGRGGLTLAAGNRIVVDGTVDSEGPIQILIGAKSGTVEITGSVRALASPDGTSPSLVILGRGSALVTGALTTRGAGATAAGDVTVDLYGRLAIHSYGEVASIAGSGGAAGTIRLKSETELELVGAIVGDPTDLLTARDAAPASAGNIELEAGLIAIGEGSVVSGSAAKAGTGGSVILTAGTALALGRGARVSAGSGLAGGALLVASPSAEVGEAATLTAGLGLARAGTLRLEVSGPLALDGGATIAGGTGACASGGTATLLVAGRLELAAGALVEGGSGGIDGLHLPCADRFQRGGDVEVTARSIDGPVDTVVVGGSGSRPGGRRVAIAPTLEVPPPNLTVATTGWIESKTFDRGADAASTGRPPRLVALQAEMPAGTSVRLWLGGLDDPGASVARWYELSSTATDLAPLGHARWLRYKLTLVGRAFDTPVLDFFDIDLARAGD